MVIQKFLSGVLKCLVSLDRRVTNIEEEVQPCVKKEIQGEMCGMQMKFESLEQRINQKLEDMWS